MFKYIGNTQTLRNLLNNLVVRENRTAFCQCSSSVPQFIQAQENCKAELQVLSKKVNNNGINTILSV